MNDSAFPQPGHSIIAGPVGLPLELLEWGPGQAGNKAVILVHGLQRDARIWSGVAARLAHRYRVVAPNLRGRGESHHPRQAIEYDLSRFADDLHCVIDAVGANAAGPLTLIGWSMGCNVALEYLNGWGHGAIGRLVLINGTPRPGRCRWLDADDLDSALVTAERRARQLGSQFTADPFAVAASWLSARTRDYSTTIAHCPLPCLILHGADDADCPAPLARDMCARFPNARYEELPGCGHGMVAEHPDRVAARLLSFLA